MIKQRNIKLEIAISRDCTILGTSSHFISFASGWGRADGSGLNVEYMASHQYKGIGYGHGDATGATNEFGDLTIERC